MIARLMITINAASAVIIATDSTGKDSASSLLEQEIVFNRKSLET